MIRNLTNYYFQPPFETLQKHYIMESARPQFIHFKDRGDLWKDIEPQEQYEGGPAPIAPIQYPEQYVEVLSYFRAIYTKREISERAFQLTREVIYLSQGNYTAWNFRRELLHKLGKDLGEEMAWLNAIGINFEKNYQIWHHRRCIFEMWVRPKMLESGESKGMEQFKENTELNQVFDDEIEYINMIFSSDAKNYHCWSHKIWMIERYGLWAEPRHMEFAENLMNFDVRNNSVWSFRYFLIMRTADKVQGSMPFGIDLVKQECMYVLLKRLKDDWVNEAAWAYLRGMLATTRKEAENSLKSNAKKVFIGDLPEMKVILTKWYNDSKAEVFDASIQEPTDGQDEEEAQSQANMRFEGCKNNRFLSTTLADIAIANCQFDEAYEFLEELQKFDKIRHKLYDWRMMRLEDQKQQLLQQNEEKPGSAEALAMEQLKLNKDNQIEGSGGMEMAKTETKEEEKQPEPQLEATEQPATEQSTETNILQ